MFEISVLALRFGFHLMPCVFSRHFSHGPISSPSPPTRWYCIAYFRALFFISRFNQCQHHQTTHTHAHYQITESALSNHSMDCIYGRGFFFFFSLSSCQSVIHRWLKSKVGHLVQSIDLCLGCMYFLQLLLLPSCYSTEYI